jgi:hypothetical protein
VRMLSSKPRLQPVIWVAKHDIVTIGWMAARSALFAAGTFMQ